MAILDTITLMISSAPPCSNLEIQMLDGWTILSFDLTINSCLARACVQLHLERAFVCNFSQFDLCSQLLLGWNKAIAQNWSGDNFEMLSNGFQSLEVWMARAIRGRMPPCWETRDSSDSTLWSAGLHIITSTYFHIIGSTQFNIIGSTYFNIIGSTQFHRPFVNELDSLQVKSNVWRFLEIGRLEIRMIMINMWWTATNAFVLSQTNKLASLEATLVRNYDPATQRLTDRGKV